MYHITAISTFGRKQDVSIPSWKEAQDFLTQMSHSKYTKTVTVHKDNDARFIQWTPTKGFAYGTVR